MKQKVALVLGSGGARGVAHIGVINELLRQGYEITSISGTSMGALVGGMYATGNLKTYEEWMCTLGKREVFSLIDFTLSMTGLIKGNKILQEMKLLIPDRKIEDLPIPFVAIATDIINGKEVILEKGSLYDAIRASISIPTVFTPFNYNGLKLVDGGVLNPVPINEVKRHPGDILIVVNPGSDKEHERVEPKKNQNGSDNKYNKYISRIQTAINNKIPENKNDNIGYYNLLNKTTSLMTQKISQMTIDKHKPDVLIDLSRDAFGTYEFYNSKEIIEFGVAETKKALKNINILTEHDKK